MPNEKKPDEAPPRKPRFDEEILAGAQALAEALLRRRPEVRSVMVVVDWDLKGADLPNATLCSKLAVDAGVCGSMLEAMAVATHQLILETARQSGRKDALDGAGTQRVDAGRRTASEDKAGGPPGARDGNVDVR